MSKPFKPKDDSTAIRDKIIGLGERSVRKSYYPELLNRIAELEEARAHLEEGERRFHLLTENANDIIFTADMDLKFTYISPSVTRIRGFTVEEAMAQTITGVLTPGSLEVVVKTLEEELEIEASQSKDLTRTRTLELEETCKDGSTIWTETTISGLRDGESKLVGLLGITRDISERKRVEEALQESEQRLFSVIQGILCPPS